MAGGGKILRERCVECELLSLGAVHPGRDRVYSQVWGHGGADAAVPSLKRLLPPKAEEQLQRDRDFHDPLEEAHKRPPFVNFKR